ncbi:MAG: 4Fe-4S binding protein [Coriobacteriales bacterium]|jgi:anaerobic dimethyl sulfoxide reductase subunit B (iron-sulfur subunit)|nr:4Fe-4S binding protein [Coriobacteriales bacterium]
MAQHAFFFDGTRCSGCKTCVYACKDKKNLKAGSTYRHVYEYTGGQTRKDEQGICVSSCFSYSLSMACNHCESSICVQVCPTGAMHKEEKYGVVLVDESRCVGCGYCHMACPYNAPHIDAISGHSVKCDACIDLLNKGEKPVCVLSCPARALKFGEAGALQTLGQRAAIAPLPDPKYTQPNLFIKPSRDTRPYGSQDGVIANPQEVK